VVCVFFEWSREPLRRRRDSSPSAVKQRQLGDWFSPEASRGWLRWCCLRVTFSVSSVFEDGKRRHRLVFRGGVSLVFSYHPSTGEGLLDSSLVV
ncbi:unnamed protein product, partial [Brassica oleracea]